MSAYRFYVRLVSLSAYSVVKSVMSNSTETCISLNLFADKNHLSVGEKDEILNIA